MDSRRAAALGARVSAVGLLAMVGAIGVSRFTVSDDGLLALPWLVLSLGVYLLPAFGRNRDLFSPSWFQGFRGAFGIVAILAGVLVTGEVELPVLGYLSATQRSELVRTTCVLNVVAHLSYLLGYSLGRRRADRSAMHSPMGRWSESRAAALGVFFLLIFGVCYWLFDRRLGGSIFDFGRIREGKALIKSMPEETWLVRGVYLGFIPPLLLTVVACSRRSKRLLALAVLLLALVSVLAVAMGPRGPIVGAGLLLLVTFHYSWRRVPVPLFLGLLMLAVVTNQIFGEYRLHGEARSTFQESLGRPIESLAQHEDDRRRLDALAVVLYHFPEKKDFLWGESFRALALFWIPRWIWPEKNDFLGWGDTGIVWRLAGAPLPTPLHGVFYANFGWLGVVLGMGLFGAFHRRLYAYLERSPGDPGAAALYVSVMSVLTPTALGLAQTLQTAVPIAVSLGFLRARPRAESPRALLLGQRS